MSATLCELGCPPLPTSAIDSEPALLVTAILPETFPVADGANVTFNTAVCPGVSVVFAPVPFALKFAPATSTLVIVTLTFPVFDNVTPSALLLPTKTLPKSSDVVLALSEAVDAMPMPLVVMAKGDVGASLTSETAPVTFPADTGVKTTLNVAF